MATSDPTGAELPLMPVCAIGASAGGVQALSSFFGHIRDDLGLAYVVIMHLDPTHPSELVSILQQHTRMRVEEVTALSELRPNCIYMIPPDRELLIDGNNVAARPFDAPRGSRAPIDMFFRSLAAGRGDGLAVILSGAGSDGATGVRAVKEAGGVIFVQEPKEADYPMMPRSAIATGVADFVAPVEELVERIDEVSHSKEALRRLRPSDVEDDLRHIVNFLRARTGHDFSSYKRATVMRRITRRMQVARCDTLEAYAVYLRENPEEAQNLFSDLLISVTMFFRDPVAFKRLAQEIGALLESREPDAEVRAWVVGCATGEEAYSLAILFREEASSRDLHVPIQIFATDLDEGALATAREGRYPASIEADVSEERLSRFFVREGAHYRIRSEVRELVLFASHSALKDPPFMRIDLVSCRNMLIYLERDLQRQLCTTFHYGLNPNGYLFLGSAESVDVTPELFRPVDREARIYQARAGVSRPLPILDHSPLERSMPSSLRRRTRENETEAGLARVHARTLEESAPPSIMVDDEQRILHISETAGRFIQPPRGLFTSELAAVVRPELRLDLQGALHRAIDQNEATLTLPILVAFDGTRHRVILHVVPVEPEGHAAARAIVFFLDGGVPAAGEEPGAPDKGGTVEASRLTEELRGAHERLATSRKEYEVAIQELRAANEELQSINEEYRSTSEELETSKEELQSINEELQTVNAELKSKLESISTAHSDLQNLILATDIGTLFLDTGLRIKLFTPTVAKLFNVTENDIGRTITDFTHNLIYDGIERDAAALLRDLAPIEREIAGRDGSWLLMRMRPYRTIDDRIDGVVVSFVDITARRETEARLRESEARLKAILDAAEVVAVAWDVSPDVLHEEGPVERVFPAGAHTPHATSRALIDSVHPNDRARVQTELARAAAGDDSFAIEFRVVDGESGDRWLWLEGAKAPPDAGGPRILGTIHDITAQKAAENSLRMLVGELNHRVKNMLAIIISIAHQTQRTSTSIEGFVEAFDQRVQAIAGAHNLLTSTSWSGADLRELVRSSLAAFIEHHEQRVSVEGPPVMLSPDVTITLSMALNELSTNALKYGALSTDSGSVDIEWRAAIPASEDRSLVLTWSERGGPPVAAPSRRGFGSRMLEVGIAHQIGGRVTLDFDPTGLVCRMELPTDGHVRFS
jgi:two-component system CheB/CheR fusion protein